MAESLAEYAARLKVSEEHFAQVVAAGYTLLADLDGVVLHELLEAGMKPPVARKLLANLRSDAGAAVSTYTYRVPCLFESGLPANTVCACICLRLYALRCILYCAGRTLRGVGASRR